MDSSGGITPPPPPPPPPPGGSGGAGGAGGALPPRGLGDILSAAFDVYKANAAGLIMIVAVVVVPLTLISSLITKVALAPKKTTVILFGQPVGTVESRSFGVFLLAALVAAAIGIIITAVLQAAMLRAAAQATVGDPVDIEASYRWGLKRFPSVLLVSILVGLAVAFGFILLIIPGVIFLAMLSVSIPALVIENLKGTDAMSRSWNLVKGHFWHVLGTVVVAALISGVVGGILGSIGGSNWFVNWIFTTIGTIVTAPFTALVTIILYLDLRARVEALTADRLRSELASNA